MSDHEAIRALTYEYTFRLDRGDFAGVAELLAEADLRMAAAGMNAEPVAAPPLSSASTPSR